MEVISRKEAQERGLKHYFNGKPCRRGHIAERIVADRHCVACKKDRTPEQRARDTARGAIWRKLNRPLAKPRKKLTDEQRAEKARARNFEQTRRRRALQRNPLIYVIGASLDLHKVGLTRNLYDRVQHLKASSPVPLEVVHTIPTAEEHLESFEAYLHRCLITVTANGFVSSAADCLASLIDVLQTFRPRNYRWPPDDTHLWSTANHFNQRI
jgi:hypothetical protein